MASDAPTMYLQKAVNLLIGTRGLGRASRVREGYLPYSMELDFRGVDETAATAKVAWAGEQAPYAEIKIVPGSGATGTLTVFVHVGPNDLALYLAEHALLQATGQTWETATGALPALLKRTISETVGAGTAWSTLITRMQAAPAMLYATISLLDGDTSVGTAAGVLSEAIQSAVSADAQATLRDTLQIHISTLARVTRALETGDYLAGA